MFEPLSYHFGQSPHIEISVKFQGDTSKWDAKKQISAAMSVIKLLEAVDINLHGKKTCKWVITGMSKDD